MDCETKKSGNCPLETTENSRREFIKKIGSTACGALLIPLVKACEINEFTGDSSSPDTIICDLNNSKWLAITKKGGIVFMDAGSKKIALIRTEDKKFSAISRICSHAQADMHLEDEGEWDAKKFVLTCTRHLSTYDSSGKALRKKDPDQGNLDSFKTVFDEAANKVTVFLKEKPSAGGTGSSDDGSGSGGTDSGGTGSGGTGNTASGSSGSGAGSGTGNSGSGTGTGNSGSGSGTGTGLNRQHRLQNKPGT